MVALPRMCHRKAIGFWAVLLLVLVVSPVTAPFSSCDLGDLVAGRDLHDDGILQAKTAKDDCRPAASTMVLVCLPRPHDTRAATRPGPMSPVPAALDIPLRL